MHTPIAIDDDIDPMPVPDRHRFVYNERQLNYTPIWILASKNAHVVHMMDVYFRLRGVYTERARTKMTSYTIEEIDSDVFQDLLECEYSEEFIKQQGDEDVFRI